MDCIEIEYNREFKPLEAVLSGVRQPGDFFVCGAMEMPLPRVEVDGVGTLSFPVPEAQIAAIVRMAEQAPYGRGEETIVDTSVRNVWQVAPGNVRIGGKSWETNFQVILSKVSAGLGCEGASVSAEFYKMLVYNRNGFFLAHRDTEKTDRMFGTLVLTLPSTYRGGQLRIRHAGRLVTLDTNATDPSELAYAAFYADCEHEVMPVREGSRVCLVYNLIQKPAKGRRGILKAPDYEARIAEAAAMLDRFLNAPDAPAKIVWILDHQYSPAGLSFAALKGVDAARSRVLAQAAARADCVSHLGIVHIGESGAAEEDYEEHFYGPRRNRYAYSEYGEEVDEEEDARFTAVTVDDAWQYVDEWRDTEDRVVNFGRLPVAGGELLPDGVLDGESPDRKRLMEASGNEGATYERSYRRAALVLWRRSRTADVLLQAGVVAVLPHLQRLVAGGTRVRPEAISVAERILKSWPGDEQRWDSFSHEGAWPGPADRIAMIAALSKLKASGLIERFVREILISTYDGAENAALLDAVKALGNARAGTVLAALVSAKMPQRPNKSAELLLALTENPAHRFPEVAEAAVVSLDSIVPQDTDQQTYEWESELRPRPLGPQFLENLLLALERVEDGTLCAAAARKIVSRPSTFSPVRLIVPAIEAICVGCRPTTAALNNSLRLLWTGAAEFLLQRSETPPPPPSDWSLKVELSCSCQDCRELLAFAHDPAQRVYRFRVRKERRRHLHAMIGRHELDITHVTERVGSPQTLVCTKDRRTFVRRIGQYRDEIAAMQTLVGLKSESIADAVLSRRLENAVKRADGIEAPGRG